MSTPLIDELRSILAYPESAKAPTLAGYRKMTVDSATKTTVTSSEFNSSSDADNVLYVIEALDGNVKNQFALILAMDSGSNIATITPFTDTPSGLTQCNLWDVNIPRAVCTTNATANTAFVSTLRSEADDYWNNYHMLFLEGANQELKNITDFVSSTHTFTVTSTANVVVGDACIPVQPIQPSAVTINLDAGTTIEREIITDTLAQEGVIVGAQDGVSVSISPEIRGLSSAAGSGSTATAPAEAHVFLGSVFDLSLGTGGVVSSPTNSTSFGSSANVDKYDIVVINGEAVGVTDNSSTMTVASHLSRTPSATDVIYATATYKPKDTGHTSVGFLTFLGDKEIGVITGGMPSVSVNFEGNTISKYEMEFSSVGGFWATRDKAHDDIYDTTAPIPVKSNISRVLINGTELDADVLSITGELIPAPTKKNASFGTFENNGGFFYTTRSPALSMSVYMEDSDYWKQFRSMKEFDLLIQVGSVPGSIWALWAPRAQIVESPAFDSSDGQMTQNLNFRLLRPTTAGQPDFVIAHG